MTIDTTRIIDILQDALLRELGDEVELIFRFGSSLKGSMHQYSDLDISYVPVHESTWNNITVMVADRLIDLFPLHWSQLEQMANFNDVRGTLLLENQIIYQVSEAATERFRMLAENLRSLQQPEARPVMLRKAQDIFTGIGYQYYLLRQQVAKGHQLSCMQHAQHILRTAVHCLMVCNQSCIDTRKLSEVLALPKLPEGFADTVNRVTTSFEPEALLSACETLLNTTRTLLLAEQQQVHRNDSQFSTVFHAAYPELKGDLQHIMLACERQDMFHFTLMSLYHELMIHMAQAFTGVEYSDFNTLAEYEQNLTALGFPDLLPYVVTGDFDELHRQCLVFDQRLREFLTEYDTPLNTFATVGELETFLEE